MTDLHLPTLTLVVCVVLFTAAATMTLVGRTQRTYLGYGWWTTAQWLNTAGAVCLVEVVVAWTSEADAACRVVAHVGRL